MTTKIRKGQAPAPLERGEFALRFRELVRRSGVSRRGRGDRPPRGDRLGRVPRRPQGADHAQGRPRLRRSGLRPLGRVDRDQGPPRAGAGIVGRSEDEDARARHLRLAAQRRHLPGRDLEDVPPRRARQRGADEGAGRGRFPRPEPAHLRLRPQDPSVQGLRVDGDAAVPLAVQLLSEPLARPGRRLDERDLRALGRGARDRHRHADALVQHARAR